MSITLIPAYNFCRTALSVIQQLIAVLIELYRNCINSCYTAEKQMTVIQTGNVF